MIFKVKKKGHPVGIAIYIATVCTTCARQYKYLSDQMTFLNYLL